DISVVGGTGDFLMAR
nr:RecName: Full=Dirigent-like protein [Pinus halepensis]